MSNTQSHTEVAKLCKCLKCDITLIDQNPQVGAKEYPITGKEIEMQYVHDNYGGYWVCPVCNSDGNLIDL